MRWRDIRFEQPTEADADSLGRVLILHKNGYLGLVDYESTSASIAWMPPSELPAFTPIPDPPEGWRFVQKGEAFDKRAMYLNPERKEWRHTVNLAKYGSLELYTYIVPIDPPKPPEPQYRPFANAAEFEPHENKRWRHKCDSESMKRLSVAYDDEEHHGTAWAESLGRKEFADGSPFGVRAEQ
jgi:hypothetical protein